jgi:hypothetical protein
LAAIRGAKRSGAARKQGEGLFAAFATRKYRYSLGAASPEQAAASATQLIRIGDQRPRNVEGVLGELRRSAFCSPGALRGCESDVCALPNEAGLEFGKRAVHLKH